MRYVSLGTVAASGALKGLPPFRAGEEVKRHWQYGPQGTHLLLYYY